MHTKVSIDLLVAQTNANCRKNVSGFDSTLSLSLFTDTRGFSACTLSMEASARYIVVNIPHSYD